MKEETIGIIMPTYNARKYVADAIRSVMDQDYANWLLLVLDDGSSDNTCEIVREFMRKDDRIRLLESTGGHRGVCNARSRGIEAAETPWIAFLDSDDMWLPDKLSTQLRVAHLEQSGFVFTGSAFMDSCGQLLDYILHVPERVGYPGILKQNIISCSSVLIRAELLRDCFKPSDAGICEDFAAWIRVLRDLEQYAVGIDRPLLQYRLSPGSLSSNKLRNAFKVLKTYRACGLSVWETLRAWVYYVHRGLRKYGQIRRAKQQKSTRCEKPCRKGTRTWIGSLKVILNMTGAFRHWIE